MTFGLESGRLPPMNNMDDIAKRLRLYGSFAIVLLVLVIVDYNFARWTNFAVETADVASRIILAFVAVGTLILGALAYNDWKRQLIWKQDRELGKQINMDTYDFEEKLKAARNPGNPSDMTLHLQLLESVRIAALKLQTVMVEAETMFDNLAFSGKADPLIRGFGMLAITTRHKGAEMSGSRDMMTLEDTHRLYYSSDYDKEIYDEFDKPIFAATKAIRALVKPYMKR